MLDQGIRVSGSAKAEIQAALNNAPAPQRPKLPPPPKPADVFAMIEALEQRDLAGRAKIVELIATDPDRANWDSYLTDLKAKTKVGIANLRGAVKAARRELLGEDAEAPADVIDLEDGTRVLVSATDEPDHKQAVDFIEKQICRQNSEKPVWTAEGRRVVHLERHDGKEEFVKLNDSEFKGELSGVALFAQSTDSGQIRTKQAPAPLASTAFTTLYKTLERRPELRRAPMFTRDGTLIASDGWHREAGVYMQLGGLHLSPMPGTCTNQDAAEAADFLLKEWLVDFKWADEQEDGTLSPNASRANTLAYFLTIFARGLYSGQVPFFVFSKPAPGSGGTLLAFLGPLVADGEPAGATPLSADGEEIVKQVVSSALKGKLHVIFDDVPAVEGDHLRRIATTGRIVGRKLGGNEEVDVLNTFIWGFTGNNPRMNNEMERRVCWIRMNTLLDDNKLRTYKHDELEAWTLENRGRIISCLLTMIRAWVQEGRPAPTTDTKLPSFGSWVQTIGGILETAGVTGFLTNPRPAQRDRSAAEALRFVSHWASYFQSSNTLASEGDLFSQALNVADGMALGWTDAERQACFIKHLEAMAGRTYRLEHGNACVTVMRQGDDWHLRPTGELQPTNEIRREEGQ
jgi:hypothetical protein